MHSKLVPDPGPTVIMPHHFGHSFNVCHISLPNQSPLVNYKVFRWLGCDLNCRPILTMTYCTVRKNSCSGTEGEPGYFQIISAHYNYGNHRYRDTYIFESEEALRWDFNHGRTYDKTKRFFSSFFLLSVEHTSLPHKFNSFLFKRF